MLNFVTRLKTARLTMRFLPCVDNLVFETRVFTDGGCIIDPKPDVADRQRQHHELAIHRTRRADEHVNCVRAYYTVSSHVFLRRSVLTMVDLLRDVPVFAFSIDLGTIKSTSSPVT